MNKLIRYMQINKINARHIAQKLDMGLTTVYGWANGSKKPTIKNAAKLQELTKGYVKITDWL